MSLLETFYVMFDADTTGLKKGTADAKKTTDELNNSLKATDQISQKVGASFHNLVSGAVAAATAIFSISAIVGGIKSAAEYSNKLGETSKALKVNVEDLDAWSGAIQKSGGTAQDLESSITAINKRIQGTSKEAAGAIPYLSHLADVFQRLNPKGQEALGKQLGLGPGTIALLQQGRREIDDVIKRQKELGVVTAHDAEVSHKFNDQLDNTAHAFRSLFTTVGSTILPALTAIFNVFEKLALFLRRHSDLIIGGLIGISIALLQIVGIGALLDIIFSPFILLGLAIVAAGVAFAFLYDEIATFIKGGDSFIGDAVKKWPILGDIFKGIGLIVKSLWMALKGVAEILGDIFSGRAFNALMDFFGGGKTELNANIKQGQNAIVAASNSPLTAQSSNSISNSNRTANKSTSVQTGPITIETAATDANGIAGSLSTSLETQMRQAMANFDDGVRI